MSAILHFSLSADPVDPAALAAGLENPAAGAVVVFEGRVRNHNAGQTVGHLEYQAYPALAETTGHQILAEEAERHNLLAASAVHRTGALAIGDVAVWAGVASAHRGAAFDACRAIMERLKYELPVWKKETYADGRVEWVGPDNKSAETGKTELPELAAELLEIWISPGNDFRGRHGLGRLNHDARAVAQAECIAGMGIRGDRYFGYKQDYKGQITFFDAVAVDAVRQRFALPDLASSEFRRNLIVRGADLGEWVGRRFRFQGIEFEGSEECRPCYWMDQVAGPGAEDFLRENFRGGLRARILSDGVLRTNG